MGERLAWGTRKHIRVDLKPEARKADAEEDAWGATEELLRIQSPESLRVYRLLRAFHQIRWDVREGLISNRELVERNRQFQQDYSDEDFVLAKGGLDIIQRVLAKPKR